MSAPPKTFIMAIPDRKRYDPFSKADQQAFIDLLRNGCRSRTEAAGIVKINVSTVNRWLDIGKAYPDGDYGDMDSEKAYEMRCFYLLVKQAEAERETKGDEVIMTAVKGGDWRAAEAYTRRSERLKEAADRKRILKAQADAAEAEARAAIHKERILAAQAELAERGAAPTTDMLVFPAHYLAKLESEAPEDAAQMKRIMQKAGVVFAPERAMDAVVKGRDDEMAAENEALAAALGLEVPPAGDVDDEGLS